MVTTTFCVSGAVLSKSGANVNVSITNGTLLVGTDYAVDQWITQAESEINSNTRFNWTDRYTSLDNDTKKILEGAASDLAAINAISYDMGGYTSREEAKAMIDILRDSYLRRLSMLRDQKVKVFINGS